METRKKGFSLRRFIAFLMTFAMLLSIVPSDLKVHAAAGESYPFTINFFDYDGSTACTPTGEDIPENDYFMLVGLVNGEGTTVGYGIQPIGSVYGNATLNGSVGKFYNLERADEYYVAFEDPNTCPSEFTDSISGYTKYVRLMHGNYRQGYNRILLDCKDTIKGFAFMDSTDIGNDSANINIQKAEERKLSVHLINNGDVDLNVSDANYYVVVKLGHNNSADTYYFAPLTSIPAGASNITINNTDWRDQNGQPVQEKDYFTGHEASVSVAIVQGTNGELTLNQYINDAGRYVTVGNGGMVKGATVAYGSEMYEVDISNYYYDISFTPAPIEHDYSYDTLLGEAVNYGVVGKTMSHVGHSQTNIAAGTFTSNNVDVLESNLAGDPPASAPGNFIVEQFGDETTKLDIGAKTYSTADIYIPDYEHRLDDKSGA